TYDLSGACSDVAGFLDALTNWYIRRSRDRFWTSDTDAFDTLATVLERLARVTAPLLPLLSEAIWTGLTGERSVHLTDWPSVAGPRLGADVQKVIRAVKAGDWDRQGDGTVVAAGITLEPGEFDLRVTPADETTTRAVPCVEGVIVLDTALTPELEAEGLARDV